MFGYKFNQPPITSYDYIIVLGGKVNQSGPTREVRSRLDKAIEIYEQNHSVIIVSGGLEPNGLVESTVMKEYLINHGISAQDIIEENYSTSTWENLIYSKELVEGEDIAIVTSAYHVTRTSLLQNRLNLSADIYVSDYCNYKSVFRESIAMFKSLLFDH